MTTAEMSALARQIIPPVGASTAIALVDHEPGSKLPNGAPSGLGGRTTYRAGFLVDGRQRVPVGPAFDRQRDAHRLVAVLNGTDPAPRSGQTTAPVDVSGMPSAGQSGASDASPGAPGTSPGGRGVGEMAAAVIPPGICAGCGDPVPLGRHGQQRLAHGPACRVAAHRRRQAEARAAAIDAPRRSVTPSRASTEPDHIGAEQPAAAPGGPARLG